MDSNVRKLTYISFIAVSGLVGLVFWYLAGSIADFAAIPSTIFFGDDTGFSLKLTQVQWGASGVVGLGSFLYLFFNARAVDFSDECFAELYKVTWPTRKETIASTIVVGVMVLIAALIFQIMDLIWGGLFGLLFS